MHIVLICEVVGKQYSLHVATFTVPYFALMSIMPSDMQTDRTSHSFVCCRAPLFPSSAHLIPNITVCDHCFSEGVMNAALLGLTDMAMSMVVERAKTGPAEGYRCVSVRVCIVVVITLA